MFKHCNAANIKTLAQQMKSNIIFFIVIQHSLKLIVTQ